MPEPRHLTKAPITEAIFDFRVKARPGFRAEEFEPLKTQLADRFPIVRDRRGKEALFVVKKGEGIPPVVRDLGLQGYFFKAADERTLAQFRIDGYTFNRLKPYTNWEELFPLAFDLWHQYSEIARPEEITRLALRYINHIQLPIGEFEFETYLRAAPVIPEELPQHMSSFLTRTTLHDLENHVAAHVSQVLETNPGIPKRRVILDIDAFWEGQLMIEEKERITEIFGKLRELKNRIFFNSLTEKTLREFE